MNLAQQREPACAEPSSAKSLVDAQLTEVADAHFTAVQEHVPNRAARHADDLAIGDAPRDDDPGTHRR